MSAKKHIKLSRNLLKLLAQVAQTWFEIGASRFGFQSNDSIKKEWRNPQQTSNGKLDGLRVSAEMKVGNDAIGEIFVTGIDSRENLARLHMDALFLSNFIQLNGDIDLISYELVQNQDQIVSLHQLSKSMRRHLEIEPLLSSLTKSLLNLFKTDYLVTLMSVEGMSPIANQYPTNNLLDVDLIQKFNTLHSIGECQIFNNFDHPNVSNLLFLPLDIRKPIRLSFIFINKLWGDFQTPDLKLAQIIGDQIGAQFEYVQMHQEVLDKTRLEAEANMARTVQMQLLPSKPPEVAGLDIYAQSKPASQVGGDFYIFIPEAALPVFILGDVSGKGMPAALLMTMLRAGFKNAARNADLSQSLTADILNDINKGMYDDFTLVEMFATGVVATFDSDTNEISYSNAGHSPVIYCPAEGEPHFLEANGPAMGVVELDIAGQSTLKFEPGDLFIICTDGFNEAWNEAGEMFGYDRLLNLVDSLKQCSAAEITAELYKAVDQFSGNRMQDDDQTIIVLKGVHDGTN